MARSVMSSSRSFGFCLVALLGLATCGDDEPPTKTKPPPVTQQQLVQGCIAATACGVKAYPRVVNCVEAYYSLHVVFGLGPVYDAIYGCVAEAAGDCDRVFTCFGAHRQAGRCDSTFRASCSEQRALSCDLLDKRVFSYDCEVAGLRCGVKQTQSFESVCTVGACDSRTNLGCQGNQRHRCIDGIIEVEDCAIQGLACGSSANGSECTGTSKTTCNNTYAPNCKGTVAFSCVGGKVHEQDCAKRLYNKSCSAGTCVASGKACTGDELNRCKDSATLEFCMDGTWQTARCADLGFGDCQASVTGATCLENRN